MTADTVIVHPDHDTLAAAVASRLITAILDSQARRGSAHVALTGGRIGTASMAAVLADPAHRAVDWGLVDFWWSDERFVPAGDDIANDAWIAFGDPAQGKERGLDLVLVQHREDARDVALDAAHAGVPIGTVDVGSEGRDLKVILDIDGQGIGDDFGIRRDTSLTAAVHFLPAFRSGGARAASTSLCMICSSMALPRSRRSRPRSRRIIRSADPRALSAWII